MAKQSSSSHRSSKTGQFLSVSIAARERVVPRSSAAYVLAGGRGEPAYRLAKIIEGSNGRYSERSCKHPSKAG